MTINGMTLCRLTRSEAEYLMMAPATAGGWIDTHADSREAVASALGEGKAEFLALLPAEFAQHITRPVSRAAAVSILAELERQSRLSVVFEEDVAAAAALRLRQIIEGGGR